MTLLTLNIMIGLVMSVKYNPVRGWPHRRINTFKIHNWTAYIALTIASIHPLIILFSSTAKFRVRWQLGQPPPRVHRPKPAAARKS